jgi:L-amino acid N-acyltransferase YncA
VLIREATDADLPAIAAFFREIVADGETYAFPEDLDDAGVRSWWFEPAPGRTVVAVDDEGVVLGSAKMGPNRPARGSHIGTASFMVSPDTQGRGVGRALGEYVVAWHREQGYDGIQFNAVVETNTTAVALWESLGFEVVATVPRAFESRRHGKVGLHVMFLPLR